MKRKSEIKPRNSSGRINDSTGEELAAQQPPESQYNPHDSGEGPAAKLWELLRRNPDFRTIACDLLRLKLQKSSHLLHIAEKFQILDVNPFAGFALRWLFRPKFVQFCFPRRPHDFFKPWTTQDWTESGFPWISDEKLRELEEILSDENHHDSYPGPLAVSKGGFTLDTPWPETPELFRFLFSWLWEEYEFGKLSDSEAARFMITGRVPDRGFEIDWTFLDHGTPNIDWETRYNLRRVRFLVENHDLFAIPRVMMTRNDEMRLRETFNMMILENSRFIDIRKYPNFLGNKTDWLVFNFCRAKISYQRDPTKPDEQPLRFGSGKALTEVIDTQRKLGKWKGDWNAHTERCYEKMESLMFAIFPAFNFARLVEMDLGIAPGKVGFMSKVALQGALEKLRALHAFPNSEKQLQSG